MKIPRLFFVAGFFLALYSNVHAHDAAYSHANKHPRLQGEHCKIDCVEKLAKKIEGASRVIYYGVYQSSRIAEAMKPLLNGAGNSWLRFDKSSYDKTDRSLLFSLKNDNSDWALVEKDDFKIPFEAIIFIDETDIIIVTTDFKNPSKTQFIRLDDDLFDSWNEYESDGFGW